MCAKCWYIDNEIQELRERKKTMICRDTEMRVILHPERKKYFQAYYRKNRDKKLAAANERHKRIREEQNV